MGAPDFSKLISHPEKQKIISKLLTGDTPEMVRDYLKTKYDDDSKFHLSLNLLKEFKDKYLDKQQAVDALIKSAQASKTDKALAKVVTQNKTWKELVENLVEDEIDLKKKIRETLVRMEARMEQVFNNIQENPGNMKHDYVMVKYFESFGKMVEQADKVINERPDTLIQNNISIQMVEQNSVAFQEAVKAVLAKMSPELASEFMDELSRQLNKMNPVDVATATLPIEKRTAQVAKLAGKVEQVLEAVEVTTDE